MENKDILDIFKEYSKYFLDLEKGSEISLRDDKYIVVKNPDGYEDIYIVVDSKRLDDAVKTYIEEFADELLQEITTVMNRNDMSNFTQFIKINTDEIDDNINQDDYANMFNCKVLDPDYYYNGDYYLIGKLND